MTFTTRALVTQEDVSTAIEQEQMKDLRVIMVRQNGSIVHNHKVENIKESSVTVTFQTPVLPDGETFKFFAIANEDDLVPDLNLESITSDKISSLITQEVGGNDAFAITNAIPQTQYWEHYIDVQESRKESISKQLEYMASKISVQFVNQTKEAQSLENIKITGIPLATKGYLFKQNDDYVDTENAVSEILFDAVTNLAAGASSAIQHYYTYPVEGITNAVLSATWKGKDGESDVTRTEPLEGVTSLPRNQHLKIVITLVGPGDIIVNYEVAEWIDNPTNISDPQPNPGGGYHVDPWGDVNDVIIGGGEAGENDWTLSDGTIIKGEQVEEDWTDKASPNSNNNLEVNVKAEDLVIGNKIILDFSCAYNNCDNQEQKTDKFKILFTVYHQDYQINGKYYSIEPENSTEDVIYQYEYGKTYVRYLTINDKVKSALTKTNGQLVLITREYPPCDSANPDAHPYGIKITRYGLIRPRSATQ